VRPAVDLCLVRQAIVRDLSASLLRGRKSARGRSRKNSCSVAAARSPVALQRQIASLAGMGIVADPLTTSMIGLAAAGLSNAPQEAPRPWQAAPDRRYTDG
jgi:hypothetical protein